MTPDIGFDDTDSDINPLTLEGPIVNIGLDGINLDQDIGFFVPAGPVECEDTREDVDPTDVDADRRSVSDATAVSGLIRLAPPTAPERASGGDN